MEVRQLRYFVAVAEERSFTRAAARLFLSQQSLSTAIDRLERQLGHRLVERGVRPLELTPAGRALLARAPAVFAALDEALAATHAAAGPLTGALRLRYGMDSERIVEPLLAGFQADHPEVDVQAWSGMDADNLAALGAGGVDAVIAWAAVPRGLRSCVIGEEQTLLAMPGDHPLARLDAVPRAAAAREPLVMFPRAGAPAVYELLVTALRGHGARAAPIHHTPVAGQVTMAEEAVRRRGVCPVSRSLAATIERPELALRPLDPPVRVPLLLAWPATATGLAPRLAQALGGARASGHGR